MNRSKAALILSAARLAAHHSVDPSSLFFWTLTAPFVLTGSEAAYRWNHFLTLLHHNWPRLAGIRVFESHQRHGVHVHVLVGRRLYVRRVRPLAHRAGWGRIQVTEWPASVAGGYVAKKIGRPKDSGFKGIRLWAAFGQWNWVKVSNIVKENSFSAVYRACKSYFGWKGNRDMGHRMAVVHALLIRTMKEGLMPGLGPGGRPYRDFTYMQLMGYHSWNNCTEH